MECVSEGVRVGIRCVGFEGWAKARLKLRQGPVRCHRDRREQRLMKSNW